MKSLAWLAAAAALSLGALSTPLDGLADRSFAWHMLQHLLLLYGVGMLIVIARPFSLFAQLAGKPATVQAVHLSRSLHPIASPPAALAVFVATLWMTHFSSLYEGSLEHWWLHAGEHVMYLTAGILFWLPVLGAPPLRPVAYPIRLLYLTVALPQGALLGMVLAGARTPLYAHYAALLGAASALNDQRNAAVLMWILGGLVIFAVLIATLAAWARRERLAEFA